MSIPVWRSVPRPKNMNDKPKMKSPMLLFFFLYMRKMAKIKAGHTRFVMLKAKPADIIQAVSVVPMFAPIITLIA